MSDTDPDFPPFVYAPVVEREGRAHLAMNTLADGRTGVFVYSALDRLRDLYDAEQAWVVATVDTLSAAGREHPFDVLFLDTAFEATEPGAATTSDNTAAPPGVFLAGSSPVAQRDVEV